MRSALLPATLLALSAVACARRAVPEPTAPEIDAKIAECDARDMWTRVEIDGSMRCITEQEALKGTPW